MYVNPTIYDTHDYGTRVNIADIDACFDAYGMTNRDHQLCSPEFNELVHLLKDDITIPTTVEAAIQLFTEITCILDNIDI